MDLRMNTYIGHEWVLERTQRLLDASRELRMAAADHVEELMGALKNAAKKKLEALRKRSDAKQASDKGVGNTSSTWRVWDPKKKS